jgi:MoxR-like ATPase
MNRTASQVNAPAIIEEVKKAHDEILGEVGKVIVGQRQVIDEMLIALLSRGHCLLVGVPGLAKTLLISTFANMVLADEINRTPPKTQAALLQAMQEHEVTAAGETYKLEEPFFVLATQNPIEQEGTYPLPEAQLDRFMFNLWVDYPSADEEKAIVKSTTGGATASLKTVLDAKRIIELQELVRQVPVADIVVDYAVKLARHTRPNLDGAPKFINDWISWGAGPRASQYLILGAKTRAILDGRATPDIDDVRAVARPVLRHRLVTNFAAEAEGVNALEIVNRLLEDGKM